MLAQIFFSSHLEDDEHIAYVAHRHMWLARVPLFKSFMLGITIPVFVLIIFPPLWFIWGPWLILGFLHFLYSLADWYFDAWLITDKSILDIEWNGFFHRSSARIEYHTINGVSYEIKGFWGTLFKYGTINVDTFGSNKLFVLENAENPKQVELEILKAQELFVQNKSFRDHETLKGMLAEMLQNRKS